MRRTAPTLAALSLLLGTASCVTEATSGAMRPRGVRTSGFIVNADVESTWTRVRSAVQGMTNAPLMNNGVPHSIRTTVQGTVTTILVEARDSRSTAVHVNSQNAKVAHRIQAALR